jgi:2-aminoadipate transaminase
VTPPFPTAAAAEIPQAAWTRDLKQSPLREIHTLLSRPGLLSFALGMPAQELFPVRAYSRAARHVLRTEPDALQYGLPPRRLRAHVVELMARRGVECTEAEVFLTSGAQHAMSLLGKLLVTPGGTVVVEEMAYDGMLNALRPLQPRVLTVPSDLETGMDLDALEALLDGGERPALVYAIPEGHNPLGTSMPAANRRRLAELAARYGVPVIEDDAYGLLGYDGEPPAAVRALEPRWTLYVGSFSKITAPALRSGWVVAPPELVQRLSILKQGSDLDVCSFAQRTLSAFLDREDFGAHLERLREAYTPAATPCWPRWPPTSPPTRGGAARAPGCSCGCRHREPTPRRCSAARGGGGRGLHPRPRLLRARRRAGRRRAAAELFAHHRRRDPRRHRAAGAAAPPRRPRHRPAGAGVSRVPVILHLEPRP